VPAINLLSSVKNQTDGVIFGRLPAFQPPGLKVRTGVNSCDGVFEHKTIGTELTTEAKIRQRIRHLFLYLFHTLLLNHHVEHSAGGGILMIKNDAVFVYINFIGTGLQISRWSPFVRVALTFVFTEQAVAVSPIFVGDYCLPGTGRANIQMNDRLKHIGPYINVHFIAFTAGLNVDQTPAQFKTLQKFNRIQRFIGKTQPKATAFEETTVFVETAAARKIHQ
jgi:hypothetical protein